MGKNIKWVFEKETKELEILNCYNERNEKLIEIISGNSNGYWKNGSKKIYEINFCIEDEEQIETLEIILNDKLEELKGHILDFSIEYWQNKILGRSKNITRIYNKMKNNEEIGSNDLYVLYGLYNLKERPRKEVLTRGYNVGWFGYEIDPRIITIIKNRDQQKDFEMFTEKEQIELIESSKNSDSKYDIKLTDKNIILKTSALYYADDSLLSNINFIKRYILESEMRADVLKYTKGNINKNKEIVMMVLENKLNDDFKYADKILRNDFEVALLAVKNNGLMLEYVGETLKDNIEIIENAIIKDKDAIKFVSQEILEQNPQIQTIYLVNEFMDNYLTLSKEEKEQVKPKLFELISKAPESLKNNKSLMRKAYSIDENTYQLAGEMVKKRLTRKKN